MGEMYPLPSRETAQKRRSLAPSQQTAFDAFSKAAFADGVLPAKIKQIIAVAVAQPVTLSTNKARGGVRVRGMVLVLTISIVGAIVALVLVRVYFGWG
jgi:hypothetical protein